jgi:hypothetical protein
MNRKYLIMISFMLNQKIAKVKMLKFIKGFGIFIPFFIFLSCHNPVEPDNIAPGRRDYTWTVDTIKIKSFTQLVRIGGSSPNDLWVVGSGGLAEECLWHYDGIKWTSMNTYVSSSFYGIFGLRGNEVWAGDISNKIYKYDGKWSIFQTLPLNGYDIMYTVNLWGDSPTNIYSAGGLLKLDSTNDYTGIIGHYDGNKWSLLNTPYIKVGFHDVRVQTSTGMIIIEGSNDDHGQLEKILAYDNKEFKELFSGYKLAQLGYINGEVYIIIDKKIYKYLNNTLTLWRDFSNTIYYAGFKARSEKDIIGFASDKLIHYNGENWATLLETPNYNFSDAIIFDNDYFVIAQDMITYEFYIVRGTIKQNKR